MKDHFGYDRDPVSNKSILLGEGASGKTYRGWILSNTKVKIPVALKHFKSVMDPDDEQKHEAYREYSRFGRLEYRHVVRYLRFFYDNHTAVLASELIDGKNLNDRIHDRRGGYSERDWIYQVLNWGFEIACAIDYLKGAGVIHRDIKPSNIVISDSDQRAVLIDFGVAKTTLPNRRNQSNFTAGSFVGTYAFAAPEQIAGSENGKPVVLTSKADIYGLGATLAYALCPSSVNLADDATPEERGVNWSMIPGLEGLPQLIENMTVADVHARYDATAVKEVISKLLSQHYASIPIEPQSVLPIPQQVDGPLPRFKSIGNGLAIAVHLLPNECADVYSGETEVLDLEATSQTLRRSHQGAEDLIQLINEKSSDWRYRLPTYEEWCVGAGRPINGRFDRRSNMQCLFEDGREELEWLDAGCETTFGECRALALSATDDVPQRIERHQQWPKGGIRLIREQKVSSTE